MLVADLQTRHPPVLHVGLIAIADMDRPPAADNAGVTMIEILKPMQIVQIPTDRRLLAVDLEREKSLVAAGITGGFEIAQRAIVEAAEESAGVVDANGLHLAGLDVLSFLDEGLRDRVHVLDRAVLPDGQVNAMCQQVAGHTAAGRLRVQPPCAHAALGNGGGNGPVLEEVGAIVEYPAKPALVDKILGQGHRRNTTIVERHEIGHAGLFDGIDHFFRLG